jgi:hypothetical protein
MKNRFAIILLFSLFLSSCTDINNDKDVIERIQGTWTVQQKREGQFINIKIKIEGNRFAAWRYMSLTEGDNDNWGKSVCEGEFELGPVQTYNNASTEFRHINWGDCIDIHDAFYDDTRGMYWGEWGPFE